MSTFSGVYPSKSSWQLQLDVSETTLDAANNRSYVSWALYMYRGNSDTPYNDSGTAYSVSAPGGLSGTFGAYRFGGNGTGTYYGGTPVGGRVFIASGGDWVTHNPNGTGSTTVSASHAAAATLGTGNVGASGFGLTTLTQPPGVPASPALAYVSDTQVTVSWADTSPSNGQPTSDQVQTSVNGATFAQVASVAPATSLGISAAANQKIVAQIRATNSAGSSAWSASTGAVFTTPAAPTSVVAAKDSSNNIVVSWTPHVAFTEHQHVVEHGTVTGGVTTWDGSPLAYVAAGTATYTHTAPSSSAVHVYRVSAQNTDTAALQSTKVVSNTVQLLAPPNPPTLPTLPTYLDKAASFVLTWTHNPTDTTPQQYYEFSYSTNGGTTWASTGKVTSSVSSATVAANTYAANVALTVRVRTWGSASTGGADGAGASGWSVTQTPTFKTRPVVTVTSPADGSVYAVSALNVTLGFSQAEGATFVSGLIVLKQGATTVETLTTTTVASTVMATPVANGLSYSVTVTVTDSNGLTSSAVVSSFTVTYTLPVTAVVALAYDSASGVVQVGMTFPAPGGGTVAATAVTISRTIDGLTETIVTAYPVSGPLTILDTTPTIHGVNDYTVTTIAASGATATVAATAVTAETRYAFLSTGAGYATFITFWAALKVNVTPTRFQSLVNTSQRTRPIALYGVNGSLSVNGSVELISNKNSTAEEVETFVLLAGRVCYRDMSGRRVFGSLAGSLARTAGVTTFTFTVTETSA